jgi:LysM domain-containing protein
MSRIEPSLASVLPPNTGDVTTSENAYSVQRGDTLGEIAKQNGVSLETLLAVNPQIANPDRIEIGQQINLPSSTVNATKPQSAPADNSAPVQSTGTPYAATEAKSFMDIGANLLQRSLQGAMDAGKGLYNSFADEPVKIAPGTPPATTEVKPEVPQNPSGPNPARAQELAKVDPDTLTTEAEKYDHYKQLIEAGGGTFNAEPGARNIVSVRTQDKVDAGRNDKMGTYNDDIAVLWTDADGTKHVKKFEGNVDPNRYWSDKDSQDVNNDGQKDAGRLLPGFYKYEVSNRTVNGKTEDALRPVEGSEVMVERDMNHDGLYNDAGTEGSTSSAGRSILFPNGKGDYDTGSAGCQTIKKGDWETFWTAVTDGATNQQDIGYTLVQREE